MSKTCTSKQGNCYSFGTVHSLIRTISQTNQFMRFHVFFGNSLCKESTVEERRVMIKSVLTVLLLAGLQCFTILRAS
jgi:hypothetical protein